MITAVSIHALERMNKRFGTKHLFAHINKRRNLPSNGKTSYKNITYITRGGVLVTAYPTKMKIHIYKRYSKIGKRLCRMNTL